MEQKALPEVCHIQYGYPFDSKRFSDKEGFPLIRIRDVVRGHTETFTTESCNDEYIVKKGDILIGMDGMFNVAKWKGNTAYLNQRVCKIEPNSSIVADYLFYYLPCALKKIENKTAFVTVKHLKAKQLNSILIPCPPVKEQKRIAQILDLLFYLICQKKKQLNYLDELVKSRFIEMFGNVGEIDKHKVHDAFVTKLGDVANVKSSHRVFTSEFVESGIPFYRGTEIGELSNGQIPKHPFYITREHYEKLANDDSRPKIGDLLLPSICNNGQIWLVDTNKPFYYKDGRVLCISPYPDVFNSIYLLYYLKYRLTYEYPKLGSGSTFAEFKIFQLKNMDVLVPNIMKQNLFANFIHQVDKSKYREAIFLYLLEDIRICCNI